MQGMPGFLALRYKNNTMDVQVNELKELMDFTKCDTLAVPLKCDPKACESKNIFYVFLIIFDQLTFTFKSYFRLVERWYW